MILTEFEIDSNLESVLELQDSKSMTKYICSVAYSDALKRRKGAVREVRKETTKYSGEASGIKAGLKKSVRIKS